MLTVIGFDDLTVEDMWLYFNSKIATYNDMRGVERLHGDFFGFRAGVSVTDMHAWFHNQHSKGLGYLYSLAGLSDVA